VRTWQDLAGPGIGDYAELERVLPSGYQSLLTPRETQRAIFAVKNYIEQGLCGELNLEMVTVPLIVGADSGVNDMLDRDGSRTPIGFHISNDRDMHPVDAQIVQAATKWKRVALRQFDCGQGEGICTAEDILEMYPDLPRKQRETMVLQQYPAVFIIGIGWPLADGYPHEMRAADYDDWITDTSAVTGRPTHGLNGYILVWNHLTRRRHELSSMGIQATAQTLKQQLEQSGQLSSLHLPYHQGIMSGELPLSIGGGIGQSRTLMLLLRKAHLGEVSVSVWPKIRMGMCAAKNIHLLT
jgi:asparagine synthetase A